MNVADLIDLLKDLPAHYEIKTSGARKILGVVVNKEYAEVIIDN